MSNFYQSSFFNINKKTNKFLTKNSNNFFNLLKNFRPISKDKILLNILKDSHSLRMDLSFKTILNASKVSRFKTNFKKQLYYRHISLFERVHR